jgi:GxxExxY protein
MLEKQKNRERKAPVVTEGHPCQKIKRSMLHKDLTGKIINCAYQVQKTLGFGFLESVYQNALLHELTKAGLQAQKEQNIEVTYDNQIVGNFTADIVVEDMIILELKSTKDLHPLHEAQLNNYLKATGKELGLLINFGHKIEIKRKINTITS